MSNRIDPEYFDKLVERLEALDAIRKSKLAVFNAAKLESDAACKDWSTAKQALLTYVCKSANIKLFE